MRNLGRTAQHSVHADNHLLLQCRSPCLSLFSSSSPSTFSASRLSPFRLSSSSSSVHSCPLFPPSLAHRCPFFSNVATYFLSICFKVKIWECSNRAPVLNKHFNALCAFASASSLIGLSEEIIGWEQRASYSENAKAGVLPWKTLRTAANE